MWLLQILNYDSLRGSAFPAWYLPGQQTDLAELAFDHAKQALDGSFLAVSGMSSLDLQDELIPEAHGHRAGGGGLGQVDNEIENPLAWVGRHTCD